MKTYLDRFVDFLTILGVVFPPILGIILVDYYILRTHRKVLDESRQKGNLPNETSTIGWAAIIASIIGCIVGLATEWGVPTINSLLMASVAYWLFKIAFSRRPLP
ncbi:Permease for cytosine/purines uracil thiamine allantoin (fragment) [Xenorhabdus bovienii str. oregonense]|uniref:Permease for cytosine/purines uracil thiamine allantoin n=1 Tax=Xenorhabdus bovienii str. oregonense TaxID=1398202 RepID=A0A077PAJ5_XENBV